MKRDPVVLASASPRRRVIFQYIGVPFTVYSEEVDESLHPGEPPDSYVIRLARLKAEQIHGKIDSKIIIGADTIVEVDGKILGKPSNHAEATRMLKLLSGNMHRVMTGVAVLVTESSSCKTGVDISFVQFKTLTESRIQEYVQTGEPIGKAGAYAIQGKGFSLIEEWQGSYSNIVGLPLQLTQELLISVGYPPLLQEE